MAYIGQGIKEGTFSVLDTSGNTYNGSNVTFSLGTQVGSPAQLLVSHDGVIQKPGTDYTLATGGTQITFSTAPASGASIFIVEISGAVGGPLDSDLNGTELILDADGDTSITADTDDQIDVKIAGADDFQFTANTFTAASGSSIVVPDGGLTFGSTAIASTAAELNIVDGNTSATATTIADADRVVLNDNGTMVQAAVTDLKTYIGSGLSTALQWRITASFNASNSSGTTISSNWEVSDSTAYGNLGSNMSESSGVFTFPSTGIYLVIFDVVSNGANSTAQYQYAKIQATTDNSTYGSVAITGHAIDTLNYAASCSTRAIVDVTNTSNVKVQFQIQSQSGGGNTTITGSSSIHYTGATFIRLGDT
jgi:hypothetical protein